MKKIVQLNNKSNRWIKTKHPTSCFFAFTCYLLFVFPFTAFAQIDFEYYKSIEGVQVTEIDGHRFIHEAQKLHVKIHDHNHVDRFTDFLQSYDAELVQTFNKLHWGIRFPSKKLYMILSHYRL